MPKPATFELFGATVPCLVTERDGVATVEFRNGRVWRVPLPSRGLRPAPEREEE